MKIISCFFLVLVLLSGDAYAERYLVHLADGGVSVMNYAPGGGDSLSDALKSAGFEGLQARPINEADLPGDDPIEREFWYWNVASEKVEVDRAKHQVYLDEVSDAEAARDVILNKITSAIPGLTAVDLETIGIKKPVKVKKSK